MGAVLTTPITDLDSLKTNFTGDNVVFNFATSELLVSGGQFIETSNTEHDFTNIHDGDTISIFGSSLANLNGEWLVDRKVSDSNVQIANAASWANGTDTNATAIVVNRTTGQYDSDEIHLDTINRTFYFKAQSNLSSNGTGVTGQALYSWFKDRWKFVDTLPQYDFPMVSITNEQFEFVDGYNPDDGVDLSNSSVGYGDITFSDANPDTIVSGGAVNFETAGVKGGDLLTVANSTSNDGQYRVLSVSGSTITLDNSEAVTAGADSNFIRFFTNEVLQSSSNVKTREMIRTAGWSELNQDGTLNRRYSGIISLGALDENDQVYYIQSNNTLVANEPTNFTYLAEVNQGVQIYGDNTNSDLNAASHDNTVLAAATISFSGSTISDSGNGLNVFGIGNLIRITGTDFNNGLYAVTANTSTGATLTVDDTFTTETAGNTFVLTEVGFDYKAYFRMYVRTRAKSYGDSQLADIGVTDMTTIAYRFPLTNSNDIDINLTADTDLDANSDGTADIDPYQNVTITYLSANFRGTYTTATSYFVDDVIQDTSVTSPQWFIVTGAGTSDGSNVGTEGTVTFATYSGQRLVEESPNFTYSAYDVIVNANATASGNAVTVAAVYERLQFDLRQTINIADGGAEHRGDISDDFCFFVGDTLTTRPGVFIDDLESTEVNKIIFTDYAGTTHVYPTVVQITINFNQFLANDSDAIYRAYYTSVPDGQYGQANAITVVNSDGDEIKGSVPQAASGTGSSISNNYAYSTDTTGGRTIDTATDITVVAIGLSTGQYVAVEGQITAAGATVSLVAPQERNYTNPV